MVSAMLPFRYIGSVIRKVLTWPLLVILGLNIESFVTDRGLATLISEHWQRLSPVLNDIYSVISSPYLLYPIVFILGVTFWEWIIYSAYARSKFDGKSLSKATKFQALGLVGSFREPWVQRRMQRSINFGALAYMNDLLEADGMPPVPDSFFSNERINKFFSQYLRMVSEGDRDIAIKFYQNIIIPTIDEVHLPEPPRDTTEGKPDWSGKT